MSTGMISLLVLTATGPPTYVEFSRRRDDDAVVSMPNGWVHHHICGQNLVRRLRIHAVSDSANNYLLSIEYLSISQI